MTNASFTSAKVGHKTKKLKKVGHVL